MKNLFLFISLICLTACSHVEPRTSSQTRSQDPQVATTATIDAPKVEAPNPSIASATKLNDVRGEVMKRSRSLGFPLAGEKLEILGEDGSSIASTQSESDGTFHFKGDFSNGHYLLRLVSDRFKAPDLSFSSDSYPPKGLKVFAEVKQTEVKQ